jgi:dihydropteroate synthase/2-amino-4-hydroxy-6-hydroxymethyldihydropteridine diphosphokinase
MSASITLGLGSNLAPKRTRLLGAIAALEAAGVRVLRQSPVYVSPAMLPPDAPPQWNQEFLNQVIDVATEDTPEALLALLKSIEEALGRKARSRWAPREIDLDILDYHGVSLHTPALTLPHPGISARDFVLLPWQDLAPDEGRTAAINALPRITARQWRAPTAIMGILNLAPDSFSDGKCFTPAAACDAFLRLVEEGAQIVDIGAESTRPGATPLTAEAEWARLQAPLDMILTHPERGRVNISIDTRHALTAARVLERGVEIINDVSGVADASMRQILAAATCDCVVMHSLTIPADPAVTLAAKADPIDTVLAWKEQRERELTAVGIDPARLIFDPGIGFGKTADQSLALLTRASELVDSGGRWLIGHSRKSFLRAAGAGENPATRDAETLVFSRGLMQIPVDYLRVHAVMSHTQLRDQL